MYFKAYGLLFASGNVFVRLHTFSRCHNLDLGSTKVFKEKAAKDFLDTTEAKKEV